MASGCTFFNPSVSQKRFWAKGRSAEMTSTTVLGSLAADSLNLRVEVWQVGVSRLGTMFRILLLPAKFLSETLLRSPSTSVKSGAVLPTLGRLPLVLTGLPFNVTVAMCVLPVSCLEFYYPPFAGWKPGTSLKGAPLTPTLSREGRGSALMEPPPSPTRGRECVGETPSPSRGDCAQRRGLEAPAGGFGRGGRLIVKAREHVNRSDHERALHGHAVAGLRRLIIGNPGLDQTMPALPPAARRTQRAQIIVQQADVNAGVRRQLLHRGVGMGGDRQQRQQFTQFEIIAEFAPQPPQAVDPRFLKGELIHGRRAGARSDQCGKHLLLLLR